MDTPASSYGLRARMAALLGAAMLLGAALAQSAGARRGAARAAGTVSVNDRAPMTLTGGSGTTLVEEGSASGTIPGRAQVRLALATTTAKATFTIHARGGSIRGSGTVYVHPGKRGNTYESFSGSIVVHHGTGRYAHAVGTGKLYGVLNRNSDNAEVQVVGTLHG